MNTSISRRLFVTAPAALAAITGGLAPSLADAQAAAASASKTLTIAIGGSVTSLDPHFYNASPNISLSMHIFDRLVERDAAAQPYPGLAESWKTISDTVWEFKLRSGIKWHDGKDFTADDVVFSIERVPNVKGSPGSFAGFIRAITRTEVVNPLTIRFHTAAPHPLLPTELAGICIVARHAATGADPEDFNSLKAAVGTGPYKVTSYAPGDRAELVRNDEWYGPKQPWEHVSYRFIGNDSGRTAALLAGDVDLIDQVSTSDLPRLRRDSRVKLAETQGVRVIYLYPDYSRDGEVPFVTDTNDKPLPKNPFKDIRVRQALSMAINREAICRQIMEGTAVPTGQWLPPGAFGYNPAVKPAVYDPDKAKALLAEAGYPNGFKLTLHGPNDRYPNDARTIQAVAQMWQRIGVQTQVDALPWASFSQRNSRQEYAIRLLGWGSSTGEASYTLVNILGTFDREKRMGASNNGRYSNSELDALTARASSTLADKQRETLFQQAVRMAMDDLAFIPLHQLINFWAMKRNLDFEARADERTVAMGASPAA